jgi:tRNA pseudouridine38-40 synthase
MNIVCGIEYDGTDYRGFQRQSEDRGRTIQGELEAAIGRITHETCVVNGAGRTDAGVHASGQVITFQTETHLALDAWARALNALLPSTIAVRWVREAPGRFHARFSATSRSYRYTIWNDPLPTALYARYSYHFRHPLDVDLMQQACAALIGHKDFGAFGHSPRGTHFQRPEAQTCVRNMFKAHCFRPDALGPIIYCDFTANAFLTGQVRRMVGTLILVGQGRLPLAAFNEIVHRAEKTHPGSAVPSRGLCLVQVEYPEQFGVKQNDEDI